MTTRFNYYCSNDSSHLYTELTPSGWCDKCDILSRPNLLPLDHPIELPDVQAVEVDFPEKRDDGHVPFEATNTNVPQETDAISSPEMTEDEEPVSPKSPNLDYPAPTNPSELDVAEPSPSLIQVGTHFWLDSFLNRTELNDGEPLFHASSPEEWTYANENKLPAWSFPTTNHPTDALGLLYNHYAIVHPGGLAPPGFAIPSAEEIDAIGLDLGTDFLARHNEQSSLTNLHHRLGSGTMVEVNHRLIFWTRTLNVAYTAMAFSVHTKDHYLSKHLYDRHAGFFVRCIQHD